MQAFTSVRKAATSALVLLLLVLPRAVLAQDSAASLPAYDADPSQTSISGISSGAFMAVQFGVAWSSIVKGVGIIAGGPYFCAEGAAGQTLDSGGIQSALRALNQCMKDTPPGPDLTALWQYTDGFAQDGETDPTANLARQRIYVFSGYNDTVVSQKVGDTVAPFYGHYLGRGGAGNLFYQNTIGAGHSMVTAGQGAACQTNAGEYINNCGYDQAGILLQHVYGELQPKNTSGQLHGKIVAFTQRDFIGGGVVPPKTYGMAETGYAYIPDSCASVRCRVHIALHGCLQNAETIKQDYIQEAGYNEWADTNAIIVVYPQTTATNVNAPVISDPTAPVNPNGCWDWWGYTDSNYATKNGEQIGALKAMVDRLTQGSGPQTPPPAPASPAIEAIDVSATEVNLVWPPGPSGATFEVYRKSPGSDFVLVGKVAGVGFADSGLQPATAYQYAVTAAGAGVPDAASAITATTRASPPPCPDPGSCPVQ